MKHTKFLSLLLAFVLAFGAIGACAEATYERGDDDEIYYEVLGEFQEYMDAAKNAATDDERFVLEAKAEALLLESAAFLPMTTQGGTYAIRRHAPRTVPYVQWGNDDDRLKGMVVISDSFIPKEEHAELLELWNKALLGEGEYDPAAYLTAKGHTLATEYKTTFSTAPATIDWLNTSYQSDTEITVNTVDGLVEYDNLGKMQPALAESWDISDDGLTYTFHIREGVYWYTSEGQEYAEVTANDFVAGFHHMLDCDAGLDYLVSGEQAGELGVIAGCNDYVYSGGSFDDVGYVAEDERTLVITLAQPTPYFMTMLTYSIFLPICEDFYLAHGGVYGRDEYQAAFADTNAYTFGKATDVSSQVYCGPFLLTKLLSDSEINLVRNEKYWNPDAVKLTAITWIYDTGDNPKQTYDDTVAGVYTSTGLGVASGTLELARQDGNYDKYAVITDTTSTTYFGGMNLNRGTFELASGAVKSVKTEQQKIDYAKAAMNKDFRKAVFFAFDKAAYNAVSAGEELKYNALRNMYTHPGFVVLADDFTDEDGHTFPAGSLYGDIVQYYLDEMGAEIKVADGIDGWYNPEAAKAHFEAAKEALGDEVSYPIVVEWAYYSANPTITGRAQAFKQSVEAVLGTDNVVVNLIECTTMEDYYAVGYRASTGEALGQDVFAGSGWGPDYGDPLTYLGTMTYGGYMLKVLGLN